MNDRASSGLAVSQPTAVRYGVLAWFCSLSMITYIDRVCIMQVQEDIENTLGIHGQIWWAFSAFALAYAIFEIPSGWLGDRLGARKVLSRIVLCWLLFTALTGAVWNLISLVVVRFLFGAGEAGAYPNIARGTKNWFPFRQRGMAQGLVWTFGRWGGAIAPVLIVGLSSTPYGWKGAFVLLGVLGVFWVAGFAYWFRDTPQEHPSVNAEERALIADNANPAATQAPLSWGAMVRSPTLWCLSFMYFCSNSGWSFFITFVPPYLKKDLGLEGLQLHLATGAPLFFGGIGCMLGGFFTDWAVRVLGHRWGRTLQGLLAYAFGGSLFLLAVLLTTIQPHLAFAAICLASFLKDLAMGASWSTTIDIGHRYSGTVAGWMNTIGNLGTVVSPPVVTWLVYATSAAAEVKAAEVKWGVSLYYYATMFFIASVCWLFINPRRVIVYAPVDHERLRAEGTLT